MVGLSASQLQAETLFPGDTVEYFSMAFVAGDPRGHRVAKVLRVDRLDDEFPIRVDTQEMLPLTLMLKRKKDRNGLDISSEDAKWRKLRTFKLVDGEVEGETRADRLNAGLKKGLAEALKVTQKRLAKEKDDAGSKSIMDMFLKGPAEDGETTSSARSSLDKKSTPERHKKKRKPLTPRENREQYSIKRLHDKDVPRKSRLGEKSPAKHRSEDKPVRPERQQKVEPSKHSSLKRKRSDSKRRAHEAAPRTREKSISKFFGEPKPGHSKKRTGMDLSKFVDHAQEGDPLAKIQQKMKKSSTTLNEFLDLGKKEQRLKETMNVEGGGRGSRGPDSAGKQAWNAKRTQFRQTNKAPETMRSWLTKPEEVSGGTPKKPHQAQERRLNLARDKTDSPKMNRKSGISFMLPNSCGDTSHKKEAPRSQVSGSKQPSQPRKKRGSLGTVSARAPKPQSSSWIQRKAAR